MIYLATNHASVPRYRASGLPIGWLLTPGGWRSRRDIPFAIDNGMFYDPAKGQEAKGMKHLPPFTVWWSDAWRRAAPRYSWPFRMFPTTWRSRAKCPRNTCVIFAPDTTIFRWR